MLTVDEFVRQQGAILAAQVDESGQPKYDVNQQKALLKENLLKRGISIDSMLSGKISRDAFAALQVPVTVEEHLSELNRQGKTIDEARLDMANRGFYDVDANIKQYKDRLLPEVLDTPAHLNRMKTWERDYATGSAFTYGVDPYASPTLQKSLVRQQARERKAREGTSTEYLPYLEWLNEKQKVGAGARSVATRGMGNIRGIRKLNEVLAREPEVSAEAKDKAAKIFATQLKLQGAEAEGAITGFGVGILKSVDEALGLNIPLFKDEEQTRYTRTPILDKDGRVVKDKKTGKAKYVLEESPEEMLKFNLENHTRLTRRHLNQIAKLRNSGRLSAPGKMREELWDLVQGGMMLSQIFIPLLSSLSAGAIAAEENKAKDKNFDLDDILFQQKLQGFQNVQGAAGGLHAYFMPLMNSLTGTGAPDQQKGASGGDTFIDVPLVGRVPAPWLTDEAKQQLKAFPLDAILSSLTVTKFLSGLGNKVAIGLHNKQLKALKKAGISAKDLQDFQVDGLDRIYTNNQKSYLRRILESSVGVEANNIVANALPVGLRKAAGPIGDVGMAVFKGAVIGDAFGGLPHEGAIAATGAGVLSAASQVVKNVPSVRAALTPAIYASKSPYGEKWAKIGADEFARAQNAIDAAETGGEYHLRSGDRIDLENLPAHAMDNIALLTARVDLDADVIAAKAILDDLDPESPAYAATVDKFDELRTRKFNQFAEEGEFVIRESGAHQRITHLNRRRNRINEAADVVEAEIINDARVSLSGAARSVARSEDFFGDVEGNLARIDEELAALDNTDAANDIRLNEEINKLERTNEQRQRDAYIGRTEEDQLASVRDQKQKNATLEYEKGLEAAEIRAAEEAFASSGRRIELKAQRAVLEEQVNLRNRDIEDASLFAEGLIDADELARRRAEAPEVSAVEVHAANLKDELAKHRARRDKLLARNLEDQRLVWEAMREEYRTTMRFRQGQLNPDKLVKTMRNHVYFDASGGLTWLERGDVEGAVSRPGSGSGAVTFEASNSRAAAVSQRISNLPIGEQIPVVAALEDAAVRLANAGGGISSRRFRGGGKNALYRFYYDSLARHLFDEYSPKLLRSPTMRKKFSRFVLKQLGEELGIKKAPEALLHIEEMINDLSSPRHYGGDFFVEPAYSIYGLDGVEIADLGDLFTDFVIREIKPRELRRVALEAIQSELPILQARVGANVAANTALKASNTGLQALKKGPVTKGRANVEYIKSVAEVFDKEGSLPIVFNAGRQVSVNDIPFFEGSGKRSQLEIAIATDPRARHAVLTVMGEYDDFRAGRPTPKYDQLLDALDEHLHAKKEKEWVFLGSPGVFELPETELYGPGLAPDEAPGIKMPHPAIDARKVRSSAKGLKQAGKKSLPDIDPDAPEGVAAADLDPDAPDNLRPILIRKDFSNTMGWLLRTTEDFTSRVPLTSFMRLFTGFWKLLKTGLNPVNFATNGISNFFTLMLTEGLDPASTLAVIQRGSFDMVSFIYDPLSLTPEKRARMNAILKTGGINNTILVKEVQNVFSELAKDGIKGRQALELVHGLITGRSMEGIPFGSTRGGRLTEKLGNYSTAAQRRYSDFWIKMYRGLGDELFKYTKANLQMEKNAAKFKSMAPGSSEVFFDIAKGAYDVPPRLGSVTKLDNGDLVIRRADGSSVTGAPDSPKVVKALDEFNAEAAMSDANSNYYNLGDLGKVFATARHYEGVFPFLPTFLSWLIKSYDMPFVKKGLFYRTMIDDISSISSDPAIQGQMLNNAVARSARRNLFLLGMRKREMDNDDLRRLLPKWLSKGAIYGDLSAIVTNNQIPWSMFIDVLGAADFVVREASAMMDPGFAAEHKLLGEWEHPSKGVSRTTVPLYDFAQAALGINPYTGATYEGGRFGAEHLRGVLMQIGGGFVNAPRKAIELFAEQEGVVTVGELKGMSKELIQERMLMGNQQRSVAIINALLFNRYRHINPEVLLKKIMSFPKNYERSLRKKMYDDWKIDIFGKGFDIDNPLASIASKKDRDAALMGDNMKNIENQLDTFMQFFGSGEDQGAYYYVSDRIIRNVISRMDKVNAKRFGKKYSEQRKKSDNWKNFKRSKKWEEAFDSQQSTPNPEFH